LVNCEVLSDKKRKWKVIFADLLLLFSFCYLGNWSVLLYRFDAVDAVKRAGEKGAEGAKMAGKKVKEAGEKGVGKTKEAVEKAKEEID
jgi:hypothetical protein